MSVQFQPSITGVAYHWLYVDQCSLDITDNLVGTLFRDSIYNGGHWRWLQEALVPPITAFASPPPLSSDFTAKVIVRPFRTRIFWTLWVLGVLRHAMSDGTQCLYQGAPMVQRGRIAFKGTGESVKTALSFGMIVVVVDVVVERIIQENRFQC